MDIEIGTEAASIRHLISHVHTWFLSLGVEVGYPAFGLQDK